MELTIKIPGGNGGPDIFLQMDSVYAAQRREAEIAIVNGHKAQELITCFTRAYADLTDHLAVVTQQVVRAQNAVDKRTAIILLDEVPRVLREKGLVSGGRQGGSEDQRKAVMEMDTAFVAAKERLQELEAWEELLRGKQKHMEMMYLAVRKLLGEGWQGRNHNLGSSYPEPILEEASPQHRPEVNAAKSRDEVRPQSTLRASFGSVRD